MQQLLIHADEGQRALPRMRGLRDDDGVQLRAGERSITGLRS
jgi:hypothetical protein